MIDLLIVRNFKLLQHLDFQPHSTMNLIVGDNESGKSTLLEALSFVLTGRTRGRRLADEISPYWFNQASARGSSGQKDAATSDSRPSTATPLRRT